MSFRFSDERINFAIQRGLEMSRSTVVYYRHNDAADLERLLLEQQQYDRRKPKKAAAQRRFLITEAIFQNTGEMCPLGRLVQLRAAHKLRFILDESLSFGTVGRTGRGLTELLNVDVSYRIDSLTFSNLVKNCVYVIAHSSRRST